MVGSWTKLFAKHWQSTLRFLPGNFVLNYIPVLNENPMFDAYNVGCNLVHREAEVRKSPVHDDEIPSAMILPGSYLRVGEDS
jgi:hypothetical protein